MCCSWTVNNKINELHERVLRLVYDDRQSTSEELLDKDKFFGIHRNLQVLATKMYKVYSSVAPEIVNNTFENPKKYYFCITWIRNNIIFRTQNKKSCTMGYKTRKILSVSKLKLSFGKPLSSLCQLCKVYLPQIGFI